MQSSIAKIVRNDTKARQVIENVELRRQAEEEDLKKQQQEIEQQIQRRTMARIKEDSKQQREKMTQQLKEKRNRNAQVTLQMEALYQEKKDLWVKQIVQNILSGKWS